MKKSITYLFGCIALLIVWGGGTSYSGGPGELGIAYVGAPEDFGTCGDCHGADMAYGEPVFNIEVILSNGMPLLHGEYIPLDTHLIKITVMPEFGTPISYGFQAVVLDDDNNQTGILLNPSPNAQISFVSTFNLNRQYAEHNTGSDTNVFYFTWIAGETEAATIYVNGVLANSADESDGDSGGTVATTLRLFPTLTLPVELSGFNVSLEKESVLLKWTTATETDNDYFTMQHSTNGINFQDIGRTNGAGISTEAIDYTYTHSTPQNGANYYRLQMTDYGGKNTYSKVEVIRMDLLEIVNINIYPQPATGISTLDINAYTDAEVSIEIYTLSGQIVNAINWDLKAGQNSITLNSEKLQAGTYLIVVQGHNFGKGIQQFITL